MPLLLNFWLHPDPPLSYLKCVFSGQKQFCNLWLAVSGWGVPQSSATGCSLESCFPDFQVMVTATLGLALVTVLPVALCMCGCKDCQLSLCTGPEMSVKARLRDTGVFLVTSSWMTVILERSDTVSHLKPCV